MFKTYIKGEAPIVIKKAIDAIRTKELITWAEYQLNEDNTYTLRVCIGDSLDDGYSDWYQPEEYVYTYCVDGYGFDLIKAEPLYIPAPVDTKDVVLSDDILQLADKLAENTHEVWAAGRAVEGWTYGPVRDDTKKETPCMKPYRALSDSEKAYDVNTALETLKLITKLGYKIKHK